MRNKARHYILTVLLALALSGCSARPEAEAPQEASVSESPEQSVPEAAPESPQPAEEADAPLKALGYETSFTKAEFLKEVAAVYQMAHDNGYVYGDSHGTPPCSDGFISCDRLVARTLWNLGLTDQPEGGFVVEEEEQYLTRHGFRKIEKQEELEGGDIVIQCNEAGELIHSFVLVYYDPITTECIKYDCGHFTPEGADRISSEQPFYTVLADFPERQFYCAFRIKEKTENEAAE